MRFLIILFMIRAIPALAVGLARDLWLRVRMSEPGAGPAAPRKSVDSMCWSKKAAAGSRRKNEW
jgi:hypothetical protein